MKLDFSFRNKEQEILFWSQYRNNLFDGGFGNGKTFVEMQRAFLHLATFSNYRMAICRQKYKVLKATTMTTFFKICPDNFILRHHEQDGYTIFANKSLVYWMHLDTADEQDLRGLEINSAQVGQAEEVAENLYLVLDSRVGRWDGAHVSNKLLMTLVEEKYHKEIYNAPKLLQRELIEKYTLWPRNQWGRFLVNNYMDVECNPSDEDEFHWTYRRYNPRSFERQPEHFYIHRATDDSLNDPRTISQIKSRDKEWLDKYYYGITGSPKAKIHRLDDLSVIESVGSNAEYNKKYISYTQKDVATLFALIKERASLFRILDHGDTGISACGWVAVINNIHIFYREYYVEQTLVSYNRQNIVDLTEDEEITADYADPSIFKKTAQKQGGFWSVADEYMDTEEISAPPLFWLAADNNELATRNRINELLLPQPKFFHPITKLSPAPGIYFITKSNSYPFGCEKAIIQLKAQRRKLLGSDNGKNIYSDERDETIEDHAYDFIRYHIAMHASGRQLAKKDPPRRSFAAFNKFLIRKRNQFEAGI